MAGLNFIQIPDGSEWAISSNFYSKYAPKSISGLGLVGAQTGVRNIFFEIFWVGWKF